MMHLGKEEFATELTFVADTDAGVCAGATVMTMNGETSVEDLTEGTRIITRDAGMSVLRKIECRTIKMNPIRVKTGSLGHSRPDRDMLVTPGARIHIRDWRAEALFGTKVASVKAERLVDGVFMATQAEQEMTVYTLSFDREHIIYVDGLEMLANKI